MIFNLFLRWWSGELDADEYLMSAINTLILTAGFVWGDRYRRKNLANKKKIDELFNIKENLLIKSYRYVKIYFVKLAWIFLLW